MFRFQQFSLADDRCAMKIGTDGVLLGAWVNLQECRRVLDVGTGCGLIALMMAQRTQNFNSTVDAIEIDSQAAGQASENVMHSPWQSRVTVFPQSLQQFATDAKRRRLEYERIVCNPPFFQNSFASPSPGKQTARHTDSLPRESLFDAAADLLTSDGRLAVIIPFDQLAQTQQLANNTGFQLCRQTSVRPLPDRAFKRVLLEFVLPGGPIAGPVEIQSLTVERVRHQFTDQYRQLTSSFHLRFAKE